MVVLPPQELQRQVRLRLWQEGGEEGEEEEEGERERETVCHQYRKHSFHPPHNNINIERGEEEEEEAVREREGAENVREGDTEGRQSTAKAMSKQRGSSRRHGDKELFHYLRDHFTAPSDQLRRLTTTGHLKTQHHRKKRGGGGGGGEERGKMVQSEGGEEVRWPVEAHISLPTPHHITPSLPTPHHITPSHEEQCSESRTTITTRQISEGIIIINNYTH